MPVIFGAEALSMKTAMRRAIPQRLSMITMITGLKTAPLFIVITLAKMGSPGLSSKARHTKRGQP